MLFKNPHSGHHFWNFSWRTCSRELCYFHLVSPSLFCCRSVTANAAEVIYATATAVDVAAATATAANVTTAESPTAITTFCATAADNLTAIADVAAATVIAVDVADVTATFPLTWTIAAAAAAAASATTGSSLGVCPVAHVII